MYKHCQSLLNYIKISKQFNKNENLPQKNQGKRFLIFFVTFMYISNEMMHVVYKHIQLVLILIILNSYIWYRFTSKEKKEKPECSQQLSAFI